MEYASKILKIDAIGFAKGPMFREIHQLLPTLAYGDAIGNQVLALRNLLREQGYVSEIFAQHWHTKLTKECHPYQDYRRYSHRDNLVILHYSIGGEVNEYVKSLTESVILYYHNITPARYFLNVNGELAHQLDMARHGLVEFADKFPAIAASVYNKQEMESMGFHVLGVVPPTLSMESSNENMNEDDSTRRFQKHETLDWLHVGRIAPNKRIEDIIKSFYYYHRWIESRSRLLLVGTAEGTELYLNRLYRLVTKLGLDGSVIFVGQVSRVSGFYRMADLYVSMSEHEGFCVPLVEAMRFQIPVLAFASTGIPGTLGNAGVMTHQKDYALIAEMASEMISNTKFRERILEGQRKRLDDFTPSRVRDAFIACVDAVSR